jgi:hypothetical protein
MDTCKCMYDLFFFYVWLWRDVYYHRSLVVGVPYYLLEKLNLVNAKALLYLPRILLFSLSLCYDFFLVRILKKLDQTDGCKMHHNITTGTSTGRLLKSFSTNWTTLVFLSRAFSNTFESFMVLLSIAALVLMNPVSIFVCRI